MTEKEFLEGITFLGELFNKQYSELEIRTYYDNLKEYSNDVFTKAVNKIITTEKFAPKLVDLIKVMKDNKNAEWLNIIDLMVKDGYFKRPDWNYKKYVAELEQLKGGVENDLEIERKEEQIAEEIARMEREELHAIEKSKMWVRDDTIPEWLLEDMKTYKLKQITLKQQLLN